MFSMCSGFNVHAPIDLMFTRIGRGHLIFKDWDQSVSAAQSSTGCSPSTSTGLVTAGGAKHGARSLSSPGALLVFSHSTEPEPRRSGFGWLQALKRSWLSPEQVILVIKRFNNLPFLLIISSFL